MSPRTQTLSAPRLKSLDDLFAPEGHSPMPQTDSGIFASDHNAIVKVLPIEQTEPFPKHPFRLYTGERLDDMVDSVKKSGILVPIIVREINGKYQILSGHNRVNAASIAGLKSIPAIVKTGLAEPEALAFVIETNLMQRSFSDMAHSEKAAVIALYYSELFSQGKRNDIISELKRLENPDDSRADTTCAQSEHKLNSRDIVAQEYGLDKNAVARYLRINKLIPELKKLLDDDLVPFTAAVTLSYISAENQSLVNKCIEFNKFKMTVTKAVALREYSDAGKLNEDNIYLILNEEFVRRPKSKSTPTVRIRRTVFSRYFRPEQSPKEIQGIIEEALELYYASKEPVTMPKTG